MKKEKGITLIVLVVTIVVLLILAGTSIAMLRGDNGIVIQAKNSKIETRGGEVEERVGLWKNEYKYSDTEVPGEDDFIESLKEEKLIYDEEIDTENKIITIGSRKIYYGLKEPAVIITFRIEGKEYTAEEGMTWEEWCSSKYNIDGYCVICDFIMTSAGNGECISYDSNSTENFVYNRDKITKGHDYYKKWRK